jgi:hypothetical protein
MNPTQNRKSYNWRPFEEAREYVQSLGLKNSHEWHAWARSSARPDDIPHKVEKIYNGKGWISLGDWLGTGHIAYQKMIYRPFLEARAFVRSLGLKSFYAWKAWAASSERPDDIPAGAHRTYKDKGWAGWGDWLGTGRTYRKRYARRSFEEARDHVHSLGLKSYSDWRKWCNSGSRPNDIPSHPESYYKGKGWVSWGNWLGTGKRRNTRKRDIK